MKKIFIHAHRYRVLPICILKDTFCSVTSISVESNEMKIAASSEISPIIKSSSVIDDMDVYTLGSIDPYPLYAIATM